MGSEHSMKIMELLIFYRGIPYYLTHMDVSVVWTPDSCAVVYPSLTGLRDDGFSAWHVLGILHYCWYSLWRSFNEPKGMGVGQRGGELPGQETARCAKVQWLSTNATFLASDKQSLLTDSFHLFEAFSS
jgi:hypothetical protein